jgi:hypothetical protein
VVVTAENRGPEAAPLHILPHLWFRNTWSWTTPAGEPPRITAATPGDGHLTLRARHPALGDSFLYLDGAPELLFTENETNLQLLYGVRNRTPWVKDAFHHRVVGGDTSRVCPDARGSKAAAWYRAVVPAGGSFTVRARLSPEPLSAPFASATELLTTRRREADEFFTAVQGPGMSEERRQIHRQASAGLFWTMQYYGYDVDTWLRGEDPPPPAARLRGRNWDWRHVSVADVISMPDCWEYPWFAAWDLAFHALAMASVDIDLAKSQLKLMVKEWYQHPSGQIPAYEWEFSDLNPPVLAWAAYQVFKIERRQRGQGDRLFLERVFHKLLINFAWWVNRRDSRGNNVFEGGFLGLDNISLFDRSEPLPAGMHLEQADATAWMAMYCLDLMRIALELAGENSAYEDLASKFFEHFLLIANALHHAADGDLAPWSEESGFYFDILYDHGERRHLPVKSMVGLVPLFAVHVIKPETYRALDNFRRRSEWFLARRPDLAEFVIEQDGGRRVLCAVTPGRLERVVAHLVDETEMLSPFGPRSLSREHAERPVTVTLSGRQQLSVGYEPGESSARMKGGNSNWRGPVWFPTGYMLYRSLLRFDHGFGDTIRVPAAGGAVTLRQAAHHIAERMISIFERDGRGRRPVFGEEAIFQTDPHFRDRLLFYEYFHGETGAGLGAAHQTGWTALVGDMVLRQHRAARG